MTQAGVPLHTIRIEVENVVRAHLAAFERGDFERWGARLAPNVFLTAADPAEVFAMREATLAEMHKDFDPAFAAGLKLSIQPQAIHIGASPDGLVAWSAAFLAYGVTIEAEAFEFNLRGPDDPEGDEILAREALAQLEEIKKNPSQLKIWEEFEKEDIDYDSL
jgi:hypothetical protein